jgi:hypothetical protein
MAMPQMVLNPFLTIKMIAIVCFLSGCAATGKIYYYEAYCPNPTFTYGTAASTVVPPLIFHKRSNGMTWGD